MLLDLDGNQRSQLELISIHAGKAPEQILIDAALFLMDSGGEGLKASQGEIQAAPGQRFPTSTELEARFARLLRRGRCSD
jgi:hypothetical protein